MMYNASGKTSNPSELLEITANESYTLPHKSNIQKVLGYTFQFKTYV